MVTVAIITVFFVLTGKALSQDAAIVDQSALASKVVNLVEDSLKHGNMQNHLDSLSYSSQSLPGVSLLQELSSIFSAKFQSRISIVTELRSTVESAYSGTTYYRQCCNLLSSELLQDSRFKQPVSTTSVCERVSSNAQSNAIKLQSTFLSKCMENLQNAPALKWQYFGSEQGITTLFPAAIASDCGSYDNRFRPWYVKGNVPKPKEVVIVVDTSGSMSQTDSNGVTYISLARDAAKTVMNTLNPSDQFAVVTFSSTPDVYSSSVPNGGCYASNLALATPQNLARVEAFLDNISASGATNYGLALERAFGYFAGNGSSEKDRVILFMSDGEPTDSSSSILSTLSNENSAVGNSVVLLTYGMGGSVEFTVLQEMAAATSVTVGTETKVGIFTQITTPSNLRNEMASYYNFFSVSDLVINDPIWTVPYLDAFGLGLMITASLPVYVSNRLVGVVGVDLTIEELLADSSFFKPTETSYSFVINEEGLVINHPNLPYVNDSEPLFVEATSFERDDEFLSIFESMKSGGSGNKSFVSTKVLPQGDSTMYGVREVSVRSTYYWQQISGTNFSLCLVLTEEDSQSVLQTQGSVPTNSFLYHRLDLVPPQTACQHAENYCSQDKSSIALAARSFEDPELYLSKDEMASDVRAISDYMEGQSSNNVNIKPGVKDMVVATLKADELWISSTNTELNKQVFWRYVGTSDGIFRNFPGTQMPSNYDPVVRGWYEHAQANRDKYVITPPYSDAASGIGIITLTKALYEGKQGGNHDPQTDVLVGAMGVDIVTSYFHVILQDTYTQCKDGTHRCLVLDQGGFVIIAQQFVDDPSQSFNKHVAELEPTVASSLMSSNVLQRKKCSNIKNGLVQNTYLISENQGLFAGVTFGSPCHKFQLVPIRETNAFLVIIEQASATCASSRSTCLCGSSGVSSTCASAAYPCTCPCTSYNFDYHPCFNNYSFTSTSPQPCTPETPDLTQVGTPPVDLSSLPVCYEIDFNVPTGSNVGLIVGCVIGCIGIIVLSFVVVKCLKSNQKSAPTQTTTSAPPPPPPPVQPQQQTSPSSVQYGYSVNAAYQHDTHIYATPPPAYSISI